MPIYGEDRFNGGMCDRRVLRTTPDHIQAMTNFCRRLDIIPPSEKNDTIVSSYGQSVFLGKGSKIIGERINPTGKKKFKQALKDHDLEYILREGITLR